MLFDRATWEKPFTHGESPGWSCPTCGRGALEPEYESFQVEETRESRQAHAHPDWEPDWYEGLWTGIFRCSSATCGEVAIAMGRANEDFGWEEQSSTSRYVPTFVEPPVHLLALPPDLPAGVRGALVDSFALYWASPSACAGRLRVALERYLDSVGVQRRKRKSNKAKGYRLPRLTLHERIELFGRSEHRSADLAKSFLAIKIFGNEAAHDELQRKDVLDAYEILDSALPRMSGKAARAERLTKETLQRGSRRRRA